MKVSLIVTTYNRPNALSLVLSSVLKQSVMPSEIIIADDGSGDETKELIDRFRGSFSFLCPIIHSWQEDIGFRLSRSRNKAIAQATSDYIILIDGDMLLSPHYIKDHISAAKEGNMYISSRVFLSKAFTDKLEKRLQIENIPFWTKGIQCNRGNNIRVNQLWKLLPKITRYNQAKGYMSFWRKDCISVNGFDENYEGWGREDSDFMMRMMNSGIVVRKLKYCALAYHLWHEEASRSHFNENHVFLEQVLLNNTIKTMNGIDKYL
ncbi:MAG: glycosyltransferase family 2 protein [Bacteroidales bacterium]